MCKILDISRASYYKCSNRGKTGKGRTGYRRMTTWINYFDNTNYNVKRIRRLMRKFGILSVIRRRKNKYIKSRPEITP